MYATSRLYASHKVRRNMFMALSWLAEEVTTFHSAASYKMECTARGASNGRALFELCEV